MPLPDEGLAIGLLAGGVTVVWDTALFSVWRKTRGSFKSNLILDAVGQIRSYPGRSHELKLMVLAQKKYLQHFASTKQCYDFAFTGNVDYKTSSIDDVTSTRRLPITAIKTVT